MFFVLRKLGEWQSYEKTIVSFQKTEENMEKQTHISVLSLFVLYLISPFLYEQCAFNSFHIATSAFSLPGTISYMCTAWNLRPGTNFPGTSISATLYCARQEFAPGDKLGPGTGLQELQDPVDSFFTFLASRGSVAVIASLLESGDHASKCQRPSMHCPFCFRCSIAALSLSKRSIVWFGARCKPDAFEASPLWIGPASIPGSLLQGYGLQNDCPCA